MTKKLVNEVAIKDEMNRYKELLNINNDLSFRINRSNGCGGTYLKNKVVLDLGTAKEWIEHPNRTKYVIAHELVHAKFNETRNPLLSVIVPPGLNLEYLLSELRANTIAYQMLGQNETVLEDYFLEFNKMSSNLFHVNGGYLSSDKFVNLIKKNPNWNEQAIVDAINYLSEQYKYILFFVSKSRKEKIKNHFIKQLEDLPRNLKAI